MRKNHTFREGTIIWFVFFHTIYTHAHTHTHIHTYTYIHITYTMCRYEYRKFIVSIFFLSTCRINHIFNTVPESFFFSIGSDFFLIRLYVDVGESFMSVIGLWKIFYENMKDSHTVYIYISYAYNLYEVHDI